MTQFRPSRKLWQKIIYICIYIDFFAHMEEIDLCWRMKNLGYRIFSCPQSEVYHMGGQTLSYDNPKKLYLNSRNNLAMLTKNWPLWALIFKLPIRFVMDWTGALYFLSTRGFPSFKAILKGQWDYLKSLKLWLSKRSKTNRKSTSRQKGFYRGSIVFAHFVRKVNTFSKLSRVA